MSYPPGFSSKLRADYIELINDHLDKIPIEKIEDFESVKEALTALSDSSRAQSMPPILAGRVAAIREMVTDPDLYAREAQDQEVFKSIVMERVAAKIKEIETLTPQEKEKFIAEQRNRHEEAIKNQDVMSKALPPPPGSEAHTETEAQWLRRETMRFLRENAQQNPQQPNVAVQPDRNPWFNTAAIDHFITNLIPHLIENLTRELRQHNEVPQLLGRVRRITILTPGHVRQQLEAIRSLVERNIAEQARLRNFRFV